MEQFFSGIALLYSGIVRRQIFRFFVFFSGNDLTYVIAFTCLVELVAMSRKNACSDETAIINSNPGVAAYFLRPLLFQRLHHVQANFQLELGTSGAVVVSEKLGGLVRQQCQLTGRSSVLAQHSLRLLCHFVVNLLAVVLSQLRQSHRHFALQSARARTRVSRDLSNNKVFK